MNKETKKAIVIEIAILASTFFIVVIIMTAAYCIYRKNNSKAIAEYGPKAESLSRTEESETTEEVIDEIESAETTDSYEALEVNEMLQEFVEERADTFDNRRLTDKFEDVSKQWDTMNEELEAHSETYNVRVSAESILNAKPGSVVTELEDRSLAAVRSDDEAKCIISIPEIKVDGVKTDAFNEYVVVEVTSFLCETMVDYDEYTKTAKIYFIDPDYLEAGHDLIFSDSSYWGLCDLFRGAFNYDVFGEHYYSFEDAMLNEYCEGDYTYYVYAGKSWNNGLNSDEDVVKFSDTSIEFDKATFEKLKKNLEACNIIERDQPEDLWSEDGTKFDLEGLFNEQTGYLGGASFEYQSGYNGWNFVIFGNGSYVIGFRDNEIKIGLDEKSWLPDHSREDYEISKLKIGTYFVDNNPSAEYVEINRYGDTLTRETIYQLLYLLMDSGIDFSYIP